MFDIDDKWQKDPGFVYYDFNKPEDLPEEVRGTFEYFVIDPPFITEEVWQKYTDAVELLRTPDAKILLSTIDENEEMIKEKLNCDKKAFRPSIPNLVYQYSFYANYDDPDLDTTNLEIQME